MKVLIAPDKFKDSLTAQEAVDAMRAGVEQTLPDADVSGFPLADGGDGTGGVLAQHLKARPHRVQVQDPISQPHAATWWLTADQQTAIVEMSEASGLRLLRPEHRDPLRTSTFGTGQLIQLAIKAGARRVIVCVGGSATIDGGAGALQALGWRFMRGGGGEMTRPLGAGDLWRVASISPPSEPLGAQIDVLCDVDNPLFGDEGAAAVYGPQKGLPRGRIDEVETGLKQLVYLLQPHLPVGAPSLPGSGAAGGLALGLLAAGGSMQPGFNYVARVVKLREQLGPADLVLTGEGRFDEQSLRGKVIGGVARFAKEVQTPVVAFVGSAEDSPRHSRRKAIQDLGLRDVVPISPEGTRLNAALANARDFLQQAVSNYFRQSG